VWATGLPPQLALDSQPDLALDLQEDSDFVSIHIEAKSPPVAIPLQQSEMRRRRARSIDRRTVAS
jgi:hypothetical protein